VAVTLEFSLILPKAALENETALTCGMGVEGKFGQAKRRFSLNRVMTKLPDTSETAIAITFLVINFSAVLRQGLVFFAFSEEEVIFLSSYQPSLCLVLIKMFNTYALLSLDS